MFEGSGLINDITCSAKVSMYFELHKGVQNRTVSRKIYFPNISLQRGNKFLVCYMFDIEELSGWC
jgi:hypothetical protein